MDSKALYNEKSIWSTVVTTNSNKCSLESFACSNEELEDAVEVLSSEKQNS